MADETWSLIVYRRVCRVDATSHWRGLLAPPRFEYLTGPEADLRPIFETFRESPQTLAAELRRGGEIVDRFDRLMELLPGLASGPAGVYGAACRAAVLEPNLLKENP